MIKAIVPGRFLRWAKMHREFRAERRRYSKFSGPDDGERMDGLSVPHLEMQLTKEYHRLEKALTLPNPRSPYGARPRAVIEKLLPRARKLDPSASYLDHVESAIVAQDAWNTEHTISEEIAPRRATPSRGVDDPRSFFASRNSVRNFEDRPVDRTVVDAALGLAVNTPSVCNRQPWKVRLYDTPESVRAALRFQNGNAGFGESVPVAALITTRISLFAGASERNQVFIEGGLFAMSFVWALHSLGLDTCMLNMSQSNARLARARRALGIPEDEAIIMFVAIGYGAEGHRVARSPRRDIKALLS